METKCVVPSFREWPKYVHILLSIGLLSDAFLMPGMCMCVCMCVHVCVAWVVCSGTNKLETLTGSEPRLIPVPGSTCYFPRLPETQRFLPHCSLFIPFSPNQAPRLEKAREREPWPEIYRYTQRERQRQRVRQKDPTQSDRKMVTGIQTRTWSYEIRGET